MLIWAQELARALKRLSDFRHVLVLVTSRALIACKHAAHIGIGKMDTAPAVKLLRARCMTSAQPWEPDLAQQLAELCGRNALSLTILGSFIKSGRCTMEVSKPCQTMMLQRCQSKYLTPVFLYACVIRSIVDQTKFTGGPPVFGARGSLLLLHPVMG